jgi:hypothetical protein
MKLTEKQKLRKRLKSFCGMMGDALNTLDADLLTRLNDTIDLLGQTTKIAIAGLSSSQHRGVGEFFVGERLFASAEEAKSCPKIEIRYGKTAQTDAIFGDTQKSYPGVSVSVALAGKKPDAIRLQLPHPIFAEIDFTILPAYEGDDNRAGYLVSLLDRTEVIIWCSDATKPWVPQERRFWFTVPDTLKERSILALTNAENLTDDAAKDALSQKLEYVTNEFSTSAKLFVDAAKTAVHGGTVRDPENFASSGGQDILKEVMALVQNGQSKIMNQARALRAELDTIPIGDTQPVPAEPLTPLASSTSAAPAPTPAEAAATPTEQAHRVLVDGTKQCQSSVEASNSGDFSPVFDTMKALLSALSEQVNGAVTLDRDHALMVSQIAEASEMVSLLSYENNEKAAKEAAEVLRQIATDVWSRLPAASPSDTRNLLDSKQVSASG